MTTTDCQSHKKCSAPCSATSFILFPAVAILLGWGLRGYIGGGPFAAMIPGVFLALSLSVLLRHDIALACQLALFATVGIAFGGEMTYGQTLGLAKGSDTFFWGMLGVTVKGGVWGLLGGALVGTGLTAGRFKRKRLILASLSLPVATYIGWKLINQPQLIYFSDPQNPRDESWAGLLLAALVFLAILRGGAQEKSGAMPLRFALWGLVGGALGFGGGTLFLVYGPSFPVPQAWCGWWKAMEFFFGFLLGGFFGAAAWFYRDELTGEKAMLREKDKGLSDLLILVPVVILFFMLFPVLDTVATEGDAWYLRDIMRFAYSFVFLGSLCLVLGMRSTALSWQVAITLTVFHTILDFNEAKPALNMTNFSMTTQSVILLLGTLAVGICAYLIGRSRRQIFRFYLFVMWVCYGLACVRAFALKSWVIATADTGYQFSDWWRSNPSIVPVLVIFTVSVLVTTLYIFRLYEEEAEAGC